MLMSVTFDQNSVIVRVKILSSTVAGSGKTGLAYDTSGLVISTIADVEASPTYYTQAASNVEDISTLGTYAAPSSNKCRFKEVSATYHPGLYEIQLADARFSVSGAKSLIISITGASGAAECDALIALDDLKAARGEPAQGAPPASTDFLTKLDYVYKAWRNKSEQSASETKVYADDGSTVDHKSTTTYAGGVLTKGEFGTGA